MKTMFQEYDVVITLVKKKGYKIGSVGTVIDVNPENNSVFLEMYNDDESEAYDCIDYKFSEIKLIQSEATGEYVGV